MHLFTKRRKGAPNHSTFQPTGSNGAVAQGTNGTAAQNTTSQSATFNSPLWGAVERFVKEVDKYTSHDRYVYAEFPLGSRNLIDTVIAFQILVKQSGRRAGYMVTPDGDWGFHFQKMATP